MISESQCRTVVAKIRVEIATEVGTPARCSPDPTAGCEAEVDWGKSTR